MMKTKGIHVQRRHDGDIRIPQYALYGNPKRKKKNRTYYIHTHLVHMEYPPKRCQLMFKYYFVRLHYELKFGISLHVSIMSSYPSVSIFNILIISWASMRYGIFDKLPVSSTLDPVCPIYSSMFIYKVGEYIFRENLYRFRNVENKIKNL